MSDLVERLRMINPSVFTLYKTRIEAADEIERLRAKCNQRRDDLAQAREILDERFKEIERLKTGFESEEPQEYCHNEVTGLHNMADLHEIERLTVDYRAAANKNQELMAANKSHHAEIKRLRAALERIAGWGDPDFPADDMKGEADRNYFIYDAMRTIAREALREGE